ncbi:MAG: WG repeat-containing protein [Clostridia bacterium]|nr:WG repeat-containing protein [Clostridia bacterium]
MSVPNIQFKRKSRIPKAPIIVLAVVAAAVIVAAAVLLIKHFAKEKQPSIDLGSCTWSEEGFENVSEAKTFAETMIVFTDSESGKKGLMTLGGKVTEEANHDEFFVASDAWRSRKLLAKSAALSEYLLLVDAETCTVTTRQYHGLTEPGNMPYWEEQYKHFAWHDAKGYMGKVKVTDVSLGDSLYPVSCPPSDGSKWGYVDSNLRLEIMLAYEKAMDFSGNYAAVSKDGKWGYISKGGVTVIGFNFDSVAETDVMGENTAYSFRNGLAPVKKEGKYGIINTSGEAVVNFVFDAILQGENGVYVAKREGKWGIITVAKEQMTEKQTLSHTQAGATDGTAVTVGYYAVKTSGSHLNLRAEASPEATKIAQIPNGTVISVSKSVGGWAYVKYNNLQGWVSSEYLVKSEAPTQAPSQAPTQVPTAGQPVILPSASAAAQ